MDSEVNAEVKANLAYVFFQVTSITSHYSVRSDPHVLTSDATIPLLSL